MFKKNIVQRVPNVLCPTFLKTVMSVYPCRVLSMSRVRIHASLPLFHQYEVIFSHCFMFIRTIIRIFNCLENCNGWMIFNFKFLGIIALFYILILDVPFSFMKSR